jgi:hypothetical protein
MSERPGGGTRRAESEPRPLVVRIGWVVLPLAILTLVATLAIFGDSIFDGAADPRSPDRGETAPTPVVPEEDEEDRAREEVADAATAVLDTWSQPRIEYAGWWRRLEPMLTPGGRQAYAFTDPAKLPDLRKIEVEEVVLHTTGVTATVYFTTSEGRFGVDLSRAAHGAEWLANRVVFPGGESMFA